MQSLGPAFDTAIETLAAQAPAILGASIAFLIVLMAGQLLAVAVSRILDRTGRAGDYAGMVRRLIRWTSALLGVIMALHMLGLTAIATSMLATGGVMAVILGFAFKDIGENLLAGVFLAFSRSFDVGDLVESGGIRGVVRSINLRDTHIRTGDGVDIFVPSASIFRQPLMNFTRDGLRRGSFTIGIDYGDDPEAALVVVEAAVSATRGVIPKPAPVVELADFSGAWVEVRAHLWVNTFAGGVLHEVRTAAMIATRRALLAGGYTLSSDTTTAVAMRPLEVRLDRGGDVGSPDSTPSGDRDSGAADPGSASSN